MGDPNLDGSQLMGLNEAISTPGVLVVLARHAEFVNEAGALSTFDGPIVGLLTC